MNNPFEYEVEDQGEQQIELHVEEQVEQQVDEPIEIEEPRFGLIDLVDAFTAFRHEYREQVRESRQSNEQLATIGEMLREFAVRESETRMSAANAEREKEKNRILMTLVDLDIQWTRAAEAILRSGENAPRAPDPYEAWLDRGVGKLTGMQRWFAAPLIRQLRSSPPVHDRRDDAIAEGIGMLLDRFQKTLSEFDIERVETLGKRFDGELMRSIGTVSTTSYPPGTVAQQLTPGYRTKDRVLKFADVRVAASS